MMMITFKPRPQVLMLLLSKYRLSSILSVIAFPTYSSHYHQDSEEFENFSHFLNLSSQFEYGEDNDTASGDVKFQPRMTNIALALALYLACIATVFGNSLVVIAVFKVMFLSVYFVSSYSNPNYL